MNDHALFAGFTETADGVTLTVVGIEQTMRLVRRHRLEDATIRYRHLRPCNGMYLRSHQWKQLGLQPEARGGMTIAFVTWPDGYAVTGTALCSDKDNYSKKLGRQIALGRAMAKVA